MPFPVNDPYWMQVRSFLEHYATPDNVLLAPNDFLEFFPYTYPYPVTPWLEAEQLDFAIFHKGMLAEIANRLAVTVLQQFHLALANEVFVVYTKAAISGLEPPLPIHLQSIDAQFGQPTADPYIEVDRPTSAAVMITQDRPWCLDRSLPQLLKLDIPLLVVDQASKPEAHQANQKICDRYRVPLLHLPLDRGTAYAINTGIDYWLTDPSIAWISLFQDNVDIQPNLLNVLSSVQDFKNRPLLTGYDSADHPTLSTATLAGHTLLLKQSIPGVHFHAHRDYWTALMPIPTLYSTVSKFDRLAVGQGTDEDWWITAWSPHSIVKRGGHVVCLPGLVKTFDPTETKEPSIPAIATPHRTPSSELHLDGIRVLIDGYNLQLTKGTGIKTYGISLMQALNQMGANVDVLLSRNAYKKNEILDEVYFFDNQANNQSLLTLAKGLVKTASGPLYRAKRRKNFSGYVVKRGQYSEDFLKYATSFNLPQCYDIANALYKKLHLSTQVTIPEKIDIWHATYPLPMQVRGAKKITTVHDMIPLRLPYATLDDKENFYFKVRDALKDSTVTITVSENSKKDLLTYFDVDPDRIIVTYQPIALEPLHATEEEIEFFLKRYGLEYQSYLLFVGAIEPKKNVGRLLDAYATLDTDLPLVIVGKKGWLWEEELSKMAYVSDGKNAAKKVKLLEYVSTDSLRYLYRGAYCLVFPSLYEGFGLPPVEAMHFQCPVITSNVACLPEICGEAALYVDPYDVKDIKQKIETLLGDRALRDQLAQRGQRIAQNFSTENYLKRLYRAYSKALES